MPLMRKSSLSIKAGIFILITFILIGCKSYTTDQYLNADFITKDLAPVDLLSPSNKSTASRNPKFSWAKRSGALRYLFEFSAKPDLSTIILAKSTVESSYTLSNSDLSGITQLDAASYYWRVTAIYSDQQVVSGVSVFHILDDLVVYVDSNSASAEQVGNKTFPFKSIQAGIESANTRRNGVATVAMNVYIAKGTYLEEVSLRPGISLKGGYESIAWTRNISANETIVTGPTDVAIRGGSTITAAFTATTVVDGFTINGGAASTSYGMYLITAAPTVTNNILNGGGATNGTSYGMYNSTANPTVANNILNGGKISGSGGVSYGMFNATSNPIVTNNILSGCGGGSSYGMFNNGSSPTVTNNILYGGSGSNSYAMFNNIGSSPTVTNNILNSGGGSSNSYAMAHSTASAKVTNNIFILNGNTRNGYRENSVSGFDDPVSLENNIFWDIYNSGTLRVYYDENATPINTMAGIESLTDWTGGADKGRGNIFLPAGYNSGGPFVNVPIFWDRTSANNTGSTTILLIVDGYCAARYTNGDYIEWNGDGIARQITCNGVPNPDQITITPALASAASNIDSIEIRYWGTRSSGGSQYAIDYHLQQNSLTAQDWNNIRYGGKNTSGNNCGGSGAAGAGTQSCGGVAADKEGLTRTTANAGLANNNDCAATGGVADPQPCDNSPVGETPAVPGGFSIGPYEKD